jgi:HEAT repeat protein
MPEAVAPHKSLAPELWRCSKGGGKAFLVKALTHPQPAVRASAACTLGSIDIRFVGEDEIAALADGTGDEDASVRYCAVVALGNLGGKAFSAIPVLKKALHDKGSIPYQIDNGTPGRLAIKDAAEEAIRRIRAFKEHKDLN